MKRKKCKCGHYKHGTRTTSDGVCVLACLHPACGCRLHSRITDRPRKKHPAIRLTLKDPALAEDPAVQKFLKKVAHELTKESKTRMTNMLIFGTTHPEMYNNQKEKLKC